MSKKTDYVARADACRRLAEATGGAAGRELLEREAQWRRLARGCYDTLFGPPHAVGRSDAPVLRFAR
jgi:hypothetical protein